MIGWKEYKLSEVCENIYSGGTPSSMKASYWNGNLPWLSSGETSQRYIYFTEKCITKEGAENSSTRYAYKGSTVIASAGQGHTRGQASMLCIDTYVNQSVLVLKPNPFIINPHFLYFNIDSRYNELRQLSDGTSTRGSLSGKILKDLKISLPPLNKQKRIAAILSSLDDKIEVNKRINDNLEQQAQALFKSWFVNFDPFKDQPFVESELGMIPKGWKVNEIGELAILNAGGDKPQLISNIKTDISSVPIYSNGLDNEGLYGYTNEAKIYNSAITVSARGTIGDVNLRLKPYYPIVRLVSVIPKQKEYLLFIYYALKNKKIEGVGTTQQQLTVPNFRKEKLLVPDSKSLGEFTNCIHPLIYQIRQLKNESRNLANLRDTLLPRLMSGELKVNEVET